MAYCSLLLLGVVDARAAVVAPDAAVVAASPVPSSLDAVESDAEDMVDSALAGDRAELVRQAARLKTAVRGGAATTLTRAGVAPARIRLLQSRADRVAQLAHSGSFLSVALAANAISALMPEFYARFSGAAASEVLRLDYLDREAQLRSLAGQRLRIPTIVAELDSSWKAVRPRIVARGGTREAKAFDQHVAAMRRRLAGSAKALQDEAVRGLALVDELERVLAR